VDRLDDLRRLEELSRLKSSGRISLATGLFEWANKVAPLLRFNAVYHDAFLHGLRIISTNVSSYTLEPAFRSMLNQVGNRNRRIEVGKPFQRCAQCH